MSKKSQTELPAEEEDQNVEKRWGVLLREARIKRGISVDDVCSTLHFENKLIDAIEAEQLEQLPTASFVRGYLRSYSRLLEIDAEPIVQAYSRVCGEDDSVITQVVRVKEVSSKDAGPRYATWLVIVIVVISLVVWWRAEVLLPSAVDNDAAETVTATEIIDSSVSDAVALIEEEEPALKEPEVDAVQIVAPAVEELESALSEPVPQLSTLVLKFAEDSWVEINDAQGERLYMDVAKAGQTKTVAGEPPFKMLFGNAPAVTLEYNGEIYDHSEHNSKGVARFTLGE